jgi:hypothetical protein
MEEETVVACLNVLFRRPLGRKKLGQLVRWHMLERKRVYPKLSGLVAWSENCKWYSSLPLGAVVSPFCEFCRHNPLCCFSTSVYCCCCCCLFRYRLSPETFWYILVVSLKYKWEAFDRQRSAVSICLPTQSLPSIPTLQDLVTSHNWWVQQIKFEECLLQFSWESFIFTSYKCNR